MEKQRTKTHQKSSSKAKDSYKGGGDIERQRTVLDERIKDLTDVLVDPKKNVFRGKIKVEHVPVVPFVVGVDVESMPGNTVDELIDQAAEVIGSRDEAMRWLGTPVRGLDFATPISLLGTKDGVKRVNSMLGQMEHGIW